LLAACTTVDEGLGDVFLTTAWGGVLREAALGVAFFFPIFGAGGLIAFAVVAGALAGVREVVLVTSAAGLTPAATAALAEATVRGACFGAPRRSGLTMTWRS
jgi:hypothetical protein